METGDQPGQCQKGKGEKMKRFAIVEKQNHLAVHGHFYTKSGAERFLEVEIPDYVRRGIFEDKTLSADSFEVVEL